MSKLSDPKGTFNISNTTFTSSTPLSYATNQVTIGDSSLTSIVPSSTTCSLGSAINQLLNSHISGDVIRNSKAITDNTLPSSTNVGYNQETINNYLRSIKQPNTESYIDGYTGVALSPGAYKGSVYSPTQNRIYFVPSIQALQPSWHYIDCTTGVLTSYIHSATGLVNTAYSGGVYEPVLNRIYFVPFTQQTPYHYVNCDDGTIGSYTGASATSTYVGGVFAPKQSRIYLIPEGQAGQTNWHYINTATTTVVSYTHGTGIATNAYATGCYNPVNDRIYMAPAQQGPATNWHYIDASNPSQGAGTAVVTTYANGMSDVVVNAYRGICFSPLQNRMYLIPYGQGPETNWHYINCDTGTVVSYIHGAIVATDLPITYYAGVYHPVLNRIYMSPLYQSDQPNWHYINCEDGAVVPYTHGAIVGTFGYSGGSYDPLKDRIYFAPEAQAGETTWHMLTTLTNASPNKTFMSGNLFNKL